MKEEGQRSHTIPSYNLIITFKRKREKKKKGKKEKGG